MHRFFLIFLSSIVYAQSFSQNSFLDIEKHIYNNEREKALDILSTNKSELLNGDEAYFDLLVKISESDQKISYTEYLSFINISIERNDILQVEKFIEKNIELSISQSEYDEDLFEIYWNLLNQIREYGDIKKANDIYERLVFFSENTKESATYEEFTRQKIRLQIHETVLFGIENNVEQGLALCAQMLESAAQIKDTNLMIASYYFKSGFLVSTGNLEEYIADAEKCYELDKALINGSAFMPAIIQNLLDAYIYKGVNKSRVLELINDLESDPRTKDMILAISINSMSLFEEGSEERKEIFGKFNVDNVPDLADSIWRRSELLYKPGKRQVLAALSSKLKKIGFYEKATEYYTLKSQLESELYSSQLSESILDLTSKIEFQNKELEIQQLENEKQSSYITSIILAALSLVILLVSVFSFWTIKKRKSLNQISQESLVELTDTKKQFYSHMAQELETSLAGIESGVKDLIDSQGDQPSVQSQAAIKFTLHNVSRIREKADEILVLAELENDNVTLSPTRVFLTPFMQDVSVQFNQEAKLKGVNVQLETQFNDGESFITDKRLLKIVLRNTLYQAVKNSPTNSDIHIKTYISNGQLSVEILENSKYTKGKFPQESKDKKTNGQSGEETNLALSFNLVKSINGNIGIYSSEGDTTTYIVQVNEL